MGPRITVTELLPAGQRGCGETLTEWLLDSDGSEAVTETACKCLAGFNEVSRCSHIDGEPKRSRHTQIHLADRAQMAGDARDTGFDIDARQRVAPLVTIHAEHGGDILAEVACREMAGLHHRAAIAPRIVVAREYARAQPLRVETIAVGTAQDVRDRCDQGGLLRHRACGRCDARNNENVGDSPPLICGHLVPQLLRISSNSER